jgi:hypothetical protein
MIRRKPYRQEEEEASLKNDNFEAVSSQHQESRLYYSGCGIKGASGTPGKFFAILSKLTSTPWKV